MLGKDCREISFLNRILRVTPDGLELEADPKHAQTIIKQLGLNGRTNGVTTPGEKITEDVDGMEPLPASDVSFYRSLTMRAAYLSMDRPDIAFAVKELARGMSQPTNSHMKALRRLGRFLVKEPRVVQTFPWQGSPDVLTAETDSDFAGCGRTRTSTSGYVALLGKHCIVTKTRHQSVIALSSGEAEFYAATSGIARSIGIQQMLRDWGIEVSISLGMDATPGIAMITQKGLRKAKHIRAQ